MTSSETKNSASNNSRANLVKKSGTKRTFADEEKLKERIEEENTFFEESFGTSTKVKGSTNQYNTEQQSTKKQKIEKHTPSNNNNSKESTNDAGILRNILITAKNGHADPDELKEKLHARIEELRKQRNADKSRDKKLKLQGANGHTKTTPPKPKERQIEPTEEEDLNEEDVSSDDDGDSPEVDDDNASRKTDDSLEDLDIQYSTFELDKRGKPVPSYLVKHKRKTELLKEVKQRQELLKKRPELEPQFAFENAMKRARGEKVYDNVVKLNKSLKRAKAKKQKSAKEWAKRTKEVQEQMEERQRIRAQNIKEHIQKRKETRMAKRGRAGFEGKKKS